MLSDKCPAAKVVAAKPAKYTAVLGKATEGLSIIAVLRSDAFNNAWKCSCARVGTGTYKRYRKCANMGIAIVMASTPARKTSKLTELNDGAKAEGTCRRLGP